MFNMGERNKSKHKSCEMKVCEANQVREYFKNPKIGNEALGQCVNLVWFPEKFHTSLVKIYCFKK